MRISSKVAERRTAIIIGSRRVRLGTGAVLGEGGGVLEVGFSHQSGDDHRAGYVGIRRRKRLQGSGSPAL